MTKTHHFVRSPTLKTHFLKDFFEKKMTKWTQNGSFFEKTGFVTKNDFERTQTSEKHFLWVLLRKYVLTLSQMYFLGRRAA